MEAASEPQAQAASEAEIADKPEGEVSSFAKSLFMGEIHEDMVFPYPCLLYTSPSPRDRS